MKALTVLAQNLSLPVVRIFKEFSSGGSDDRPMFAKMLNGLRQKEAQGVICVGLDRLSRTVFMTQLIKDLFHKENIDLVTLDSAYELEQHERNLEIAEEFMWESFGKFYSQSLSERIKRGIALKKKK